MPLLCTAGLALGQGAILFFLLHAMDSSLYNCRQRDQEPDTQIACTVRGKQKHHWNIKLLWSISISLTEIIASPKPAHPSQDRATVLVRYLQLAAWPVCSRKVPNFFFQSLCVARIRVSKWTVSMSWAPQSGFHREGSWSTSQTTHTGITHPPLKGRDLVGKRQLPFCTSSTTQHWF